MAKWVYLFSEGNASMRELLGGKGANLAEMTGLGLPVPQGFTITTEACTQYYEDGREINDEIHNRSAGHRFCTDSSDHNIIQQTYKICDAILDHNWNCNRKNHQIKLFISDELSKKTFLFCPLH